MQAAARESAAERERGGRDAREQRLMASLARRCLLVHVVGQVSELLGGDPQRLGRVLTNCRHHFVVQIFDKLGGFFFQAFGGLLDVAIEISHKGLESSVKLLFRRAEYGVNRKDSPPQGAAIPRRAQHKPGWEFASAS